jgi:hypothetical protein
MNLAIKVKKIEEEISENTEVNSVAVEDPGLYLIQDYTHWKGILDRPLESSKTYLIHDTRNDPNYDHIF